MSVRRVIFAIVLGVIVMAASTSAQNRPKPSGEQLEKITSAAPESPQVRPEKPRKLLVFSVSHGYYHTAIAFGQAAFKIMGEKSGAYEAVISDDISMFEPENLRQFDAVVFNNTNEDIFMPENTERLTADELKKAAAYDKLLKESLADFIRSGKGLAVTHAGSNCLLKWPEFGEILGARFDCHPWFSGSAVTARVEDLEHPLNNAFEKPYFVYRDEVYQFKDPYSRDNLRVLLSLDTEKTYVRLKEATWVHRTDNDFAIAWVKDYGKGRVFYSAIGHDHELYWHPAVLQHWLDGIQFVLGDLEADTSSKPLPGAEGN
jgi:type 1 glutamine amidotransferase